MIRFYCLILLLFISISSCRPSAQELVQQEKMKLDSEAETAVLKSVNKEQQFMRLAAEKDERKSELIKELSNARSMFQAAKKELRVIKEFQFGRSISTKAVQVEHQCMEIQKWQEEISRINKELNQL